MVTRFCEEGASVVAADIDGGVAEVAAGAGENCVSIEADVSSFEQVQQMVGSHASASVG